ncbi:MAG: transposase, partial [Rhodopirellula sp.]|nr:transposase [Rhodopirellula sp.]
CRTPAMGTYTQQCDHCEAEFFGGYNSCRNRFCPSCGGPTRARWLARLRERILPVPYFHLVFTLPGDLSLLGMANRREVYNLLFRTAWESMAEMGEDECHLGGRTGTLMVLHTWDQLLDHHPHVHCVAPGGAWSADGRWIAASEGKKQGRKRKAFFLPVKALSRLFRGKFLGGLKRLHAQGRLKLEGKLAHLADREAFHRWLTPLYQKEWVVFCEAAPHGCDGPDAVLKYLACYVAGAAISDKRLISHEGGRVTFWARDRSKKGKGKKRRPHRLDGEEFVRRYLMHVLPRGFQRVRYYGLFSHRHRATQEQVRAALEGVDTVGTAADLAVPEASEAEQRLAKTCMACGQGTLQARVSKETPLSWFEVLLASPYATAADRAQWEDRPCRARPPTSGPQTEAAR